MKDVDSVRFLRDVDETIEAIPISQYVERGDAARYEKYGDQRQAGNNRLPRSAERLQPTHEGFVAAIRLRQKVDNRVKTDCRDHDHPQTGGGGDSPGIAPIVEDGKLGIDPLFEIGFPLPPQGE